MFQKKSQWDLDPLTHFHSNFGFLEFISLQSPLPSLRSALTLLNVFFVVCTVRQTLCVTWRSWRIRTSPSCTRCTLSAPAPWSWTAPRRWWSVMANALFGKPIFLNFLLFRYKTSSSFVSFTQFFPTCGRMSLPALSLWPGRLLCRPRLVDGRRGGGPSSVAPRSRNPPNGRRRDCPISSSLFLHGPPLSTVG